MNAQAPAFFCAGPASWGGGVRGVYGISVCVCVSGGGGADDITYLMNNSIQGWASIMIVPTKVMHRNRSKRFPLTGYNSSCQATYYAAAAVRGGTNERQSTMIAVAIFVLRVVKYHLLQVVLCFPDRLPAANLPSNNGRDSSHLRVLVQYLYLQSRLR